MKQICNFTLSDQIQSFIISRYDENKNRSGRYSIISPACELKTPKILPTINYSSHDNQTSTPTITNNDTNQSSTCTDTSNKIKYKQKRHDFPTVDKKI